MKEELLNLKLEVDAIMQNLGMDISSSDHKGKFPILMPLENIILDSLSRLVLVQIWCASFYERCGYNFNVS